MTHFGVKPEQFPIDSIRFDTFHLTCAILRKVMNEVRDQVNSMSQDLKSDFTDDVLRTFFRNFHLYCWNCNFSFNRLQGNELFKFLENIELVASFMEKPGVLQMICADVICLQFLYLVFIHQNFSFLSISVSLST